MWGMLGFLRDWWERPMLMAQAQRRDVIFEDPDCLGYMLKHGLVEDTCPDFVPDNIMAL